MHPDYVSAATKALTVQIAGPTKMKATVATSEFPLPEAGSAPTRLTRGPDGAVWFFETSGNRIGGITLGGAITEYAVPTGASFPLDIVVGPDGALWFDELNTNKIGRLR
jgi:virginiamycin B lyase